MTYAPASASPSRRKWQVFDAVLLMFMVLAFLIGVTASFLATYRVGKQPWGYDVLASWMLAAVWFWLLIVGLVRWVIHVVQKRVRSGSVIMLVCFGVYVFSMWIPFGIGRAVGRFLLAKNGIDQRVAQECLLLAHSDLCVTNISIKTQSGIWELSGDTNHLSRVVHEMQGRCPTICSLKPRYIFCGPHGDVDIDLASALDDYGYKFSAEETNWVLRWYTEADLHKGHESGRKLVSLPHENLSLVLTGFGPWQTKL